MMEIQTHLKDLHIKLLDKSIKTFHCHWGSCNESGFETKHKLVKHIQEKHFHLSNARQGASNSEVTYPNGGLSNSQSVQLHDILGCNSGSILRSNDPSKPAKEVIVIEDDDQESISNSTQNEKVIQNKNHADSPGVGESQDTEITNEQRFDENCIAQETARLNKPNSSPSSTAEIGGVNKKSLNASNQLIRISQEQSQLLPNSSADDMASQRLSSVNSSNTVSQLSALKQSFRAVYPSNSTSSHHVLLDQSRQITPTDRSTQTHLELQNPEIQNAQDNQESFAQTTEDSLSDQLLLDSAFDSLPVDQQNEKLRHLASLQAQEIKRLTLKNTLQEKRIEKIEEDLILQSRIAKLLQDQNQRADDKLRSMWADLLCKKVRMREEEQTITRSAKKQRQEQISTKENSDKQMEVDWWDRPLPSSTISILTQAFVCEWEGCGKVFRTKLALKAHIPSEHLSGTVLRVKV
ncbi:2574_t:CDS:2, partial [Acaulospora colombiana]